MPLSQSHLTSSVCTQCGQCCHFEEYDPNLRVHAEVMETGQMLTGFIDGDPNRPTYLPIVLKEFNGANWLTCEYLQDTQCTNFDSDGNDLRPDRCRSWYCHDTDGVPNEYLTSGVDVDIIKIIVDNVHGTNLAGE